MVTGARSAAAASRTESSDEVESAAPLAPGAAEEEALNGNAREFFDAVNANVKAQILAEAQTLWAEGSGPIPAGVAVLMAKLDDGEKPAVSATLKELAQSYNVGLATIFRLSKKAAA